MDDPHYEGTTVYFLVFVEVTLFSIRDDHAVQGLGEVCCTAVESPMRFVFELNVMKGKNTLGNLNMKLTNNTPLQVMETH